jgi:hypothetical protein
MAKSQIKWTQELRKVVYARITMEFGTYETWGGEQPKGQGTRYQEVLKELAAYISTLSGKTIEHTAVDQQIAWAITKQKSIRAGHVRQFVMNKAAALEMGFLTGPELPHFMLAEK